MPARLSDIVRVLAELGVSVEKPSSGSHYKARGTDGRAYPIPAHNGTRSEITDVYIRGLCRFLGIDVKSFKAKL